MTKQRQKKELPDTGGPLVGRTAARRAAFGALLLSASVFASACSGCGENNDPQVNMCEDVECERGLCEVATGECINSSTCNGDDDLCLDGYTCQEDGTCAAEVACGADGTCERGECVEGACVNPESCSADTECTAGSICEAGECIADPCADVTCERGVCARTSGECVNSVTCTESEEETQCLDGFKCDAQQCVDEDTFCASLACDQGVCDFDTKSCVDADDCAGEDANCLDGNFCNDDNTCAANECLPEGTKCMGGGECVPATGECVNPESCTEQADCLPMNVCIAGACVVETEACGADGCPGNQECIYLDNEMSATCEENTTEGCSNAIDCADDRICVDGACTTAVACEADAFEPNDDDASATAYVDAQNGGAVSASICSGDIDVFTFNTGDDPDDTGQGVLLVELEYAPEAVGLGTLKVELLAPSGAVAQEGEADADGKVSLTQPIGVVTSGEYTVRVSDNGDVLTSGVSYNLYMDVVNQTVITACGNPPELLADTDVASNSASGDSTALRATCADRAGEAAEDIYRIEVPSRSYITAIAVAEGTADVSLSLRSECLSDDSEVAGACSDAGGEGASETINGLVEPGSYFLVVQGGDSTKGGSYVLSWTRQDVVCTSADNSCSDADTASVCRPNGTGFDTEACGGSGCDSATGLCNRPLGDVCSSAPVVELADGPFTSAPIVWADLGAEYDPGTEACLPSTGADATSIAVGADVAYQVNVPTNYVMTATLTPEVGSAEDVSLYIADDCLAANLCEVGANDAGVAGAETVVYSNTSGAQSSVYVIADSDQVGSAGSAVLSVVFDEIVCTTGSNTCLADPVTGADSSGTCNPLGTAYEGLEECYFGCDATTGLCNPPANDSCDAPQVVTSGVTVSGRIDDYANDHNVDSTSDACRSVSSNGGDAIYAIDVQAGDIVTATVDATFDSVIWVADSCDTMNSELVGCQGVSDSGNPEQVTFVADTAGTYLVSVAAWSSAGSGTYDLTVDVQTPNCTPGQPTTCNAAGTGIEYCDSLGLLQSFDCGGNGVCSNGACEEPQGDICVDALPLTVTNGVATATGSTSSFTNVHSVGPGCTSTPSTNGADAVYSIELQAGDIVNASVDATFDSVLWASSGCTASSEALPGCLDSSDSGNPEEIFFAAPAAGTYYISVAAWSSTGSGTYDLTVNVGSPDCTPGDPAVCSATGDAIEYCDSYGLTQTFSCGGNGVCSNGACEEPSGELCADAIAVNTMGETTGTVTGTFDMGDNASTFEYPAGTVGSCDVVSASDGADTFFNVNLAAGDMIELTLTSSSTTSQMYVLESCATPDSCLAGLPSQGSGTLYFIAPNDGTYSVVVDNSSTFITVDFDVDWKIISGAVCVPNSTFCEGPATVSVCDASGLAVEQTFACAGSCVDGACEVMTSDIDACDASAPVLTSGTVVSFNYDNLSADVDISASGCTGLLSDGPDAFFNVEVPAGEVLVVQATHNGASFEETILYVIEDCAMAEATCQAGAVQGTTSDLTTLNWFNNSGQPAVVTVGVDNESTTVDNDVTLVVYTEPSECVPGQPMQCALTGDAIEYCNESGLFERFDCGGNGVCSNGACEEPDGEYCVDAIPMNPAGETSGTVSGSFDSGTNPSTFEYLAGTVGSCDVPLASDGADTFFTVDLSAGDLLTLDLDTTSTTAQMYVLENCTLPDSCLAGLPDDGAGTAYFLAPADGTYSVVVDNSSTFTTASFDVNWSITPGAVCVPNSTFCADATNVSVCGPSGLSVEQTFACATSCVDGGCDVSATTVDACDLSAPAVTSGSVFKLNYDNLVDDVEISSAGCAGETTDGPDAFFNVDVPAGEVLVVETIHVGTSTQEAIMYIVEDCAMAEATCQAGVKQNSSSDSTELAWTNTSGQDVTVAVGIDNESTTVDDDITVIVYTVPAQCTPNDPSATTCSSTSELSYCDGNGLLKTYACGGNGNCTGNSCEEPQGSYCFDQQMLNPLGEISGSVSGSFSMANGANTTTFAAATTTGSCDVVDESDGADTYYSVSLAAGDVIELELDTTSSTSQMYVLGSCADTTTCLSNLDEAGTGGVLYFTAPADGIYSVVVDNSSDTTTTSYDLNWRVISGAVCVPNQTVCASPNTVSRCENSGLAERVYDCPSTCTDGACDAVAADVDVCAMTAVDVGLGTIISLDWADLTNDVDLASPNCTGFQTDGPDAFFTVQVPPNEILQASLVEGGNSGTVLLYAVEDCAAAATNDTCLAGVNAEQEDLFWFNNTGNIATITVGVDNTIASPSDSVGIEVRVRPSECVPGDDLCEVTGGPDDVLRFCEGIGLYSDYVCTGGCGTTTANECDVDSGDSCVDAIALPVGGGTVTGTIDNYANDYVVGSTCSSRPSTNGGDVVYSLEALAGDVITAELSSTNTDFDSVLWASSACDSLVEMGGCLDSDDSFSNGGELITFTAPADGTYYIAVAAWSASGTGDFELSVSVQSPVCSVNAPIVCNATNTALEYCGNNGLALAEYSCGGNGLCVAGACDEPTGDVCFDAVEIDVTTGMGSASGTTTGFNNTHSVGPGCTSTPSTNGADTTYFVNLLQGQTLTATLTATYDTVLWASESCSPGVEAMPGCLDSDDGIGSGGETITFTAATDGVYYINVAAWSSTGSGTHTVDVTVQ